MSSITHTRSLFAHKTIQLIIDYDTKRYYFAELVGSLYNMDLSDLDSEDQKKNLTLGKDTHTSLHKIYYGRIDADGGWPEFDNLYKAFVREVIFPLFEDDELMESEDAEPEEEEEIELLDDFDT